MLETKQSDIIFAFYSSDRWDDSPMGIYDTKTKKVVFEPKYKEIDILEDGYFLVEA